MSLQNADQLFEAGTYRAAAAAYREALRQDTVPADRRTDTEYRVCVALGRAELWDDALESALAFYQRHRGTMWEVRGLTWLSELYLALPSCAYLVHGVDDDARLVRGEGAHGRGVPANADGSTPRRFWLLERERWLSRCALETARLRCAALGGEETRIPEIGLCFALVRQLRSVVLGATDLTSWVAETDPVIDPAAPYDADWPIPRKILYLFARIRLLAGDQTSTALFLAGSLLEEGLWLVEYYGVLQDFGNRVEGGPLRCLFESRQPDEVLASLLDPALEHPWRDHVRQALAMRRAGRGELEAAVRELRVLAVTATGEIDRECAQYQLRRITEPELAFESGAIQLPERPATLQLTYRNIDQVHFAAHRFDLAECFAAEPSEPKEAAVVPGTDLSWKSARRFFGERVAEGWIPLAQGSPHRRQHASVSLPVLEPGAYAVELRAAEIQCVGLVIVSNLAVIQLRGESDGLALTVDAGTGAVRGPCEILARGRTRDYVGTLARLRTADNGLAGLPGGIGTEVGTSFSALAIDGEHLALSRTAYCRRSYEARQERYAVHVVTDCPVYRPGQTAYLRVLIMEHRNARWVPVADESIRLRTACFDTDFLNEVPLRTNEWGAATAEVPLGEDAALGMYRITVLDLDRKPPSFGDGRFRVEEYRKPEFSVELVPEGRRLTPEQPARVIARASYLWGAPVTAASVTYRIYREPAVPRGLASGTVWKPLWYRIGPRELVEQGEVPTDDRGFAELEFVPPPEDSEQGIYQLRIEVDVFDSSRRVISGSITLHVSRRSLQLTTHKTRGYETPGEPVEVEVSACDLDGRPLPAAGRARVYRQFRSVAADPETDTREELVHDVPLETDPQGIALIRWTPERGGSYRFAFETTDPETGDEVSGSSTVWVRGVTGMEGPGSALALRSDRRCYRQGDTARVLITAPRPESTVLVGRIVEGELERAAVLEIVDGELEIDLRLGAAEVPSVQLLAVSVRDGEVYQAVETLTVQPVGGELTVTLVPEKRKYRPGEAAVIRVATRGPGGSPVAAELCVAVSDAALTHIQQDLTFPIGTVFGAGRRSHFVSVAASPQLALSGHTHSAPRLHSSDWGTVDIRLPSKLRNLLAASGGRDRGTEHTLLVSYPFDDGQPSKPRSRRRPEPGIFYRVEDSSAQDDIPDVAEASSWGPESEAGRSATGEGGPGRIRARFTNIAFWCGSVRTGEDGEAVLRFNWPDNLTEWRAFAAGNSLQGEVGDVAVTLRTSQELLVRPQVPRFLVEGDAAVISIVAHNYGSASVTGTVWLDLPDELEVQERSELKEVRVIAAGGEIRVDWQVRARASGRLPLQMGFRTAHGSDAAEAELVVLTCGARVTVVQSGELRGAVFARDRMRIRLPANYRPGTARLVVRTAPSLLGAALDALPYLLHYPYGCVEQTVSRFLPAVLVKQSLLRMGIDAYGFNQARAAARGREQTLTGPVQVAHTPYTFPEESSPRSPARAGEGSLNEHLLEEVLHTGLRQLSRAQNADGGWGWWAGMETRLELTACVLEGLLAARDAGYSVPSEMLERGLLRLSMGLGQEEDETPISRRHWRHDLLFTAAVLAPEPAYQERVRNTLRKHVHAVREELSPWGHAQLAFALAESSATAEAEPVLANLLDRVRTDPHAGTAWWAGSTPGWEWHYHRGEIAAAALRAIVRIRPGSPVAPMVVRWLVQNRRGLAWYSTRETAVIIRALLEYAEQCSELSPDYTLHLSLGDRARMETQARGAEAVLTPTIWEVPDEFLGGDQELVLEKNGPGALYYSASLECFSAGEQIPATANGLTVRRHYYRVRPIAGAPTQSIEEDFGVYWGKPPEVVLPGVNPFLVGDLSLLDLPEAQAVGDANGTAWERSLLQPGDALRSGDLIEVELGLEAENDFGYVLIEDIKPAGCEPVDLQSGLHWEGGLSTYRELRDQKVALFIERVPQGRSVLTYRLRAETPGRFTALPSFAYAMYAPEVQSLSGSCRISVEDAM